MISYTSSGMGNLKCENARHALNNVTTATFAINLTANICLSIAMQTSSVLNFFSLTWNKLFVKPF